MTTEDAYKRMYDFAVDKLKDAKKDNFAALKR